MDKVIPERFFEAEGALEGEFLKQVSVTAGKVERPYEGWYSDRKWSNERLLIWREAKPDDKLVLELPVVESAEYEVEAVFTRARDYGIVQLYLDGEMLGDSIDLYEPYVVMPTTVIQLGRRELKAGSAQLELKIIGKNKKAADGYIIGLDYIRLTKIR